MKTFLTLIAILVISAQLNAQLSPLPNKTSETWYEKVPVSGEIRTGLMMGNSCDENVKNSFYVQIPENHNYKYLNVEISSNDGRYTYTAHYNIENLNGVLEVNRVSTLQGKLKNYKCNDLAIMSWINNDITEEKKVFALSNWDSKFDANTAFVYLNSENPAILFVENKTTKETININCNKLDEEANVAYNCLCILPIEHIETSEISIVQRVRRSQIRYPLNINK